MASVSKITLLGRLGKDAVLSASNGGTQYAKFSIATEEYAGKEDGKAKYITEWWECTVFGQQAEYVGNNCKKGMDVFVEGQLKLTVKGEKVYRDVNASLFRLVSRPGSYTQSEESTTERASDTTSQPATVQTITRTATPAKTAPVAAAVAVATIEDDDSLPF